MRLRVAATFLGAIIACVAIVVWAFHDSAAYGPDGIGPASDAFPVTVHLNGAAVMTVTPDELRVRRMLADYLPEDARDMNAWKMLRAQSDRLAHFQVENPAERFEERDVCLYLLDGGWPSIGVFRRLDEQMSEAVRAQAARPGLFLGKVRDVYVWTVEVPARASEIRGPALEVVIESGGPPASLTAAQIHSLAPVGARRDRQQDGRHLLDVVGLAVDAERVESVRVLGTGATPATIPRVFLRDTGVNALLRLNRRGLWAFDMAGETEAGERRSERVRGVRRLIVTLGKAQPLPKHRERAPDEVPVTAQPNKRPSAEEKARITELIELSRLAPDADARALIVQRLDDASESVRLRAVRSLKYWDDCSPELYQHIQTEDSIEIQSTCIHTIGRKGGIEYMEDLRDWASGRSKRVLKEVDKAVRRIANRKGVEAPGRLARR
jgi:hypothetical protein